MLEVTFGEHIHAGLRLEQRYGCELTDVLKHKLVREIKRSARRLPRRGRDDRKAWLLHDDRGRGRQRWMVRHDSREFHVIYEPRNRAIVTFLPPREEFRVKGAVH